jgi:type II secretory pathway component PulF
MVNQSRVFPEMFANLYCTGEVTGKLDETLTRVRDYYLDDGTRKVQIVSRWVPILIYLIVAGMIGYFVIQFWTNYYGQMMNAY